MVPFLGDALYSLGTLILVFPKYCSDIFVLHKVWITVQFSIWEANDTYTEIHFFTFIQLLLKVQNIKEKLFVEEWLPLRTVHQLYHTDANQQYDIRLSF